MEISVVVPVYGCKASLFELYERLNTALSSIAEQFEIIFVNDDDPQNSWEIIQQICQNDKRVIGIELSRNFGQIYAINAGLAEASGKWVVVMDCDLQDRPEDIPNLYRKAHEGWDIVLTRRANRQDNFFKKLVSKLFYKVYSYATDGNYDPALSNFSICKKEVVDNYLAMKDYHRAYIIYLKWLGFRQAVIDVNHDARKEGNSSYNFKRRMKMASDILISQSDKILKLMVKVGFLTTFLSLLAGIYVFILYFNRSLLSGWPSLIVAQFFLSGIILLAIGIVGLYVGNIFMQTKGRPLYVVRQVLNESDQKEIFKK